MEASFLYRDVVCLWEQLDNGAALASPAADREIYWLIDPDKVHFIDLALVND